MTCYAPAPGFYPLGDTTQAAQALRGMTLQNGRRITPQHIEAIEQALCIQQVEAQRRAFLPPDLQAARDRLKAAQ